MQDSDIRQALIAAGYPTSIVEQLLTTMPVDSSRSSVPDHPPRTLGKKLPVLIAVIILAIGAAAVVITQIRKNHTTTPTVTPSGNTTASSTFDGKTFTYMYPKGWQKKASILAWDVRIFTPDYASYTQTSSETHGYIKQGAEVDIHIGKYGTGGLSAFKKDLETDNQQGFYRPMSQAENIAQTTINGKAVVTYTESTDNREVAIIFLDREYAIQCSYLRPYTVAANNTLQSDTTYQSQFNSIVSSFAVK